MEQTKRTEKILWSIAFPGFAQLLNGNWIKGIVFIGLEFLINVQANMNTAILASFHGETLQAVQLTNYQWLMFYPCVYMFAMYDGYRDAIEGDSPFTFLPFVFAAYFGTIGVIYSPLVKIGGVILGPIWLSILFLILGAFIGAGLRRIAVRKMLLF
jgi:hypothetical protein